MDNTFVVCGCKSWNKKVFDDVISKLPGTWHYIESIDALTCTALQEIDPQYIFFLHWSWIVPNEIFEAFECINFHMTDLPYGRGGSPLQNLILRGHKDTKLTAHRMSDKLDEGPIYLKENLSLEGAAQEILDRACSLSATMIQMIIASHPEPTPQEGEVVLFERRTPQMSEIPEGLNPQERYDFIRMLDGEGYPAAFEIIDGIRYEYRNARLLNGELKVESTIL